MTGPTGLVGAAVLSRMLADGHSVIAVSRNPPHPGSDRLTWIRANLVDGADQVLANAEGVDAVVHLAAAIHVPDGEDAETWYGKCNATFSRDLFAGSARDTIDTVIYASTLNFLRRPLERVITEEHPVALTSPYGASKYAGERALFEWEPLSRYRAVALRLPSPIAFDVSLLHHNVVKTWIEAAKRGEPIVVHGTGERAQNFVATVDVADAVALALNATGARGIFNIASNASLGMRDLADLIAARYGVPITNAGRDPNEADRWNIAGDRAASHLGFVPAYSSREVIERLLDNEAG